MSAYDSADTFIRHDPHPEFRERPEKYYIWSSRRVLSRCAAFYSKIDEFFKNETYTDVNIICQNRIFRCHRLALAAASEYFHSMFRGNFAESYSRDVVLQDIDSDTFERILLYVYRGEIPAINDDNVFSLLRASDILRLSDVEDFCVHYLTQKNIPMNHAFEIYLFAYALRKVSLLPAASQFILQNLDRLCRENEFLSLSFEDLSTLVTNFQTSSLSQEETILSAILQWVCYSTDTTEDRKSFFIQLSQKVQFNYVPATYVEEYFDRQSVQHSSSSGPIGVKIDEVRLHVYVCVSNKYGPASSPHTRIFSLKEMNEERILWTRDGIIQPAINEMRIVESADRLYSLRLQANRWTFSSSADIDLLTDEQFLAPPSGLILMNPSVNYRSSSGLHWGVLSLCRFRRDIYFCGLHENVNFQCYSTELDSWSPVPAVSERYEPINLVSDDTRLYVFSQKRYYENNTDLARVKFAAYDPRVGKVEELKAKCDFTEPGIYHRGRIYVHTTYKLLSHRLREHPMAIYDIVAGRWYVQKLQNYPYSGRLVTFNGRPWLVGIEEEYMYADSYDSYLQNWDWDNICGSNVIDYGPELLPKITRLTDVVTFRSQ